MSVPTLCQLRTSDPRDKGADDAARHGTVARQTAARAGRQTTTWSGRRSRTPSSASSSSRNSACRSPCCSASTSARRAASATPRAARVAAGEPGQLGVERRARLGLRLEQHSGPQRPRLTEQRDEAGTELLGAERLVLEERQLPPVECLGECAVGVGEAEPDEQLPGERTAERVQAGRLARRLRRRDRQHGAMPYGRPSSVSKRTDPPRAAPLSQAGSRSLHRRSRPVHPEDPRPAAQRGARARSSGRSRDRSPSAPSSSPRASGERARRRPPRASAAPARARAASPPTTPRAVRRPCRCAARRTASARARRRRDRTIVVPVESSARLRGRDEQAEQHGAEQSLVLDGRGPAWARAKIAAAGSRCSSSIAISASVRRAGATPAPRRTRARAGGTRTAPARPRARARRTPPAARHPRRAHEAGTRKRRA